MKTYPYPYHKGIIRACTREPLEKPPKPGLLPRPRQVCSIKYQFSLRRNIKDRRDLRGGVDFATPSLSPYALCARVVSSSTSILSFL